MKLYKAFAGRSTMQPFKISNTCIPSKNCVLSQRIDLQLPSQSLLRCGAQANLSANRPLECPPKPTCPAVSCQLSFQVCHQCDFRLNPNPNSSILAARISWISWAWNGPGISAWMRRQTNRALISNGSGKGHRPGGPWPSHE